MEENGRKRWWMSKMGCFIGDHKTLQTFVEDFCIYCAENFVKNMNFYTDIL